jgi:hypothetical protein
MEYCFTVSLPLMCNTALPCEYASGPECRFVLYCLHQVRRSRLMDGLYGRVCQYWTGADALFTPTFAVSHLECAQEFY